MSAEEFEKEFNKEFNENIKNQTEDDLRIDEMQKTNKARVFEGVAGGRVVLWAPMLMSRSTTSILCLSRFLTASKKSST